MKTITFNVENLEAVMNDLKNQGVEFTETNNIINCGEYMVTDDDAELVEEYAEEHDLEDDIEIEELSKYDWKDCMENDYDVQTVEVTTGMNGYPRGLHYAVIGFENLAQAEAAAKKFGGEVVSLHQRYGWQLWESQGRMFTTYQFDGSEESTLDNDMGYDYDSHKYIIGVEYTGC